VGKGKRLGRGLDTLLSTSVAEVGLESAPSGDVLRVPVDEIRPNPFQPREQVEGPAFEELVASVREHGVLQPVLVRRADDGYELIAGERRWRASREAGLESVPAVVRDLGDDDALTLALVENIQREDLNPIEKAKGFREMAQRFDLTQEEVSRRTGVTRSTISNFLRLLDLPDAVQDLVSSDTISMGHARALLAVPKSRDRINLCERIVRKGMSVREVENAIAKRRHFKSRSAKARKKPAKSSHVRDLEDRLRERVGLKVELETQEKGGKAIFHFADDDDLQHLLDVLGIGGED